MISITWDLKPPKKIHTNSSLLTIFCWGLSITSGVFPWKTQPGFFQGETTEVLVTVRPWMILGHQKKADGSYGGLGKNILEGTLRNDPKTL